MSPLPGRATRSQDVLAQTAVDSPTRSGTLDPRAQRARREWDGPPWRRDAVRRPGVLLSGVLRFQQESRVRRWGVDARAEAHAVGSADGARSYCFRLCARRTNAPSYLEHLLVWRQDRKDPPL